MIDIALPNKHLLQKNCNIPVGYFRLSCYFYSKQETIIVPQTKDGSWINYKGPKNTSTSQSPEEGDIRSGVAANGNYQVQYFDGRNWTIMVEYPSGASNVMTDPDNLSCTLYKANGTAFTDLGTMRICTVSGGLELYTRVANTGVPSVDWEYQNNL